MAGENTEKLTATLTEETEDGWHKIQKKEYKEELERWIKQYFNREVNLEGYRSRNGADGLEIVSPEITRGYVFVGPLQLDRDYEARMQRTRRFYEKIKRMPKHLFVDIEQELAGFHWEKDTKTDGR